MYKLLLFTIIGGLSGGVMYLFISDCYRFYISKTQVNSSKLSLVNLVNEGMFYGTILGYIRGYTGKPLLSNF